MKKVFLLLLLIGFYAHADLGVDFRSCPALEKLSESKQQSRITNFKLYIQLIKKEFPDKEVADHYLNSDECKQDIAVSGINTSCTEARFISKYTHALDLYYNLIQTMKKLGLERQMEEMKLDQVVFKQNVNCSGVIADKFVAGAMLLVVDAKLAEIKKNYRVDTTN